MPMRQSLPVQLNSAKPIFSPVSWANSLNCRALWAGTMRLTPGRIPALPTRSSNITCLALQAINSPSLLKACVSESPTASIRSRVLFRRAVPSGSEDPYGLRRQSVAILNMLMERGLRLSLADLPSVASHRPGTIAAANWSAARRSARPAGAPAGAGSRHRYSPAAKVPAPSARAVDRLGERLPGMQRQRAGLFERRVLAGPVGRLLYKMGVVGWLGPRPGMATVAPVRGNLFRLRRGRRGSRWFSRWGLRSRRNAGLTGGRVGRLGFPRKQKPSDAGVASGSALTQSELPSFSGPSGGLGAGISARISASRPVSSGLSSSFSASSSNSSSGVSSSGKRAALAGGAAAAARIESRPAQPRTRRAAQEGQAGAVGGPGARPGCG